MLCLLALRDEEARNFLLAQNWREILGLTPDSNMLVRILESHVRPDDAASITAFMATLAPDEEAMVAGWLREEFKDRGGEIQELDSLVAKRLLRRFEVFDLDGHVRIGRVDRLGELGALDQVQLPLA